MANRDAFGRVIHLYGDSLFRGYGLGRFPDTFTAEDVVAEPLWELRAPASMLNLIFEGGDAGFQRAPDGTVIGGDITAAYAGIGGQPDSVAVNAVVAKIEAAIGQDIIRTGDVIAFIDAGDHNGDPDAYERNWLVLRRAADQARVTVVLFDMFDYVVKREIGGKPSDMYRYDVAFVGSSGVKRSHNEATRAAASAGRSENVACRLVPMRAMMDRYRADMLHTYQVPVMQQDGIHPNIWGQWLLAAALVDVACGIGRYTAPLPALDLVGTHWRRLGYGTASPIWCAAAAREILTRCVDGAWVFG